MDNESLYGRLGEVFCEVFDDEVRPTPEMTADDVDGWDSLTHINLVVAVEQAFGVRFATAEIDGLRNVGEFAALLQAKLEA